MFPNASNTIRNRDTPQAAAPTEGALSDAVDTIRNGDARQLLAPTEGLRTDAGDSLTFDGSRNSRKLQSLSLVL